jgi:ElaB/YqjD/DUF883 family membrane-anchored ribosome-binding protein
LEKRHGNKLSETNNRGFHYQFLSIPQENLMDTTLRSGTSSSSGFSGNSDGSLDKAALSAHAAVNSIAGVTEEAARKVKPAIDHIATMAHQAVDKAAGAAAPTADWLAEKGESLKAAQKKALAGTCNYVAANPIKSVGIAVAAGFLLGRFIR